MAGLRAVVLAGAGKGFCAGLDKETFASIAAGSADADARRSRETYAWDRQRLPAGGLCLAHAARPVIAAIHGPALGGGFQIALGADIRYVAPDARLSILEIKWGLVPDMAGIALMRELARSDVIRELAMTGRVFSGAEALAYGFATSLHADPLAAARATAKRDRRPQPRCGARPEAPPEHGERRRRGGDPARRIEGAGGADRLAEPGRGGAGGDGGTSGAVRGSRLSPPFPNPLKPRTRGTGR